MNKVAFLMGCGAVALTCALHPGETTSMTGAGGNELLFGGEGEGSYGGEGDGGYGGNEPDGSGNASPGQSFRANAARAEMPGALVAALAVPNGPAAAAIVALNESGESCSAVSAAYQADCIRVGLERAIDQLPRSSDYNAARAALKKAAAKIDAAVVANVDKSQPRVRVTRTDVSTQRRSAPIRPVRADAVAAVNQAARAALQEAETVLLRSSPNATGARLEFADMAAAIGTNKVLLRS